METLNQIASSETTTKILLALVIGLNSAIALRSDSVTAKIFVVVVLALIFILLAAAAHVKKTTPEKENPGQQRSAQAAITNSRISNALLALILFITLSAVG